VGFQAIKLVRPDEGVALLHLNYISIISQHIHFVSIARLILWAVQLIYPFKVQELWVWILSYLPHPTLVPIG
jgi:hypothetical protein